MNDCDTTSTIVVIMIIKGNGGFENKISIYGTAQVYIHHKPSYRTKQQNTFTMSIPRNSEVRSTSRSGRSQDHESEEKPRSSANKVRVVARIRPLARYEIQNGSEIIVTKVPGTSGKGLPETLQVENDTIGDAGANRWYELDAVLDERSNQKDVYEKSGAQTAIAEDLFSGYNATILAYGQTGSGKTFTMGTVPSESNSPNQNDGLIPRACRDLFDNIRIKCDNQAELTCSYMEVYNEEIRDLLVNNAKQQQQQQHSQLRIRETLEGQVYVRGLTERKVTSPTDICRIMEEANKRRVVASTKMNATSSRSHAICVLKIKGVVVVSEVNSQIATANDDGISRTFEAKLTLVDLAGSERLKKTQAKGNRAKEGISINKGLFVLGKVVSALADKGRKLSEIEAQANQDNKKKRKKSMPLPKPPYRDSKLTRLLQDSLGGNSRTIMIACVSPANFNVEETTSTLRYATQARNISNTATANLVEAISQSEARKLKRENVLLKNQIEELESMISKLTQDVTEDDLERSLFLIQQEHDHSISQGERESHGRGSGGRTNSSIQSEEEKEINTTIGNTIGSDVDEDGNASVSNDSGDTINKEKEKSNNFTLEDHFHRSHHDSIQKQDDEDELGGEDKDSVSLLVDDVFVNRSPFQSLKSKVSCRISISSQASVNSNRTIEEVEDENADLAARLLLAERNVRATARNSAVELPKLKMRVRQLEDSLSESKWLEKEAKELREQLGEAKADKESAQRAAQQLTNFMEEQKKETGFRGDELSMKRVNYSRHKFNEDWVRFVVAVLNSFKEELRVLGDYFQMVVQVVESPDILDMLGMLNNRERRVGFGAGFGWWKSEEQKAKELGAVAAEKELRSTLLREHIRFFNDRLAEVEDKVNLGSESIDVVLESLYNVRAQMESRFESEEEIDSIRDLYSKKGEELISQLEESMAGKLLNLKMIEVPSVESTCVVVN